jgi:hypothetical protein
MSLKKIYIGAICNRDTEVFENINEFLKINYNVKIINLLKNGVFNLKHFKKKLNKPISLLIVKLHSEESNKAIYNAIKIYAPQIPRLNSLRSVKICESRKDIFKLVEAKCKNLTFPRCFYSINEAYEALKNGIPLIIKRNTHNIRNLPHHDRIVGIATNNNDFLKLIKKYDIKNNELFFQEYLGKFENIFKVYVINNYVQTITSHSLQEENINPRDFIHVRVPIDKELQRRIRRLGRKFGTKLYGIDYVLKDGTPYIVDINDFPSFKNVSEAISLISELIYKLASRKQILDNFNVDKSRIIVKI